jgi:uncharacterized membrane protein YhfC
MTFFLLALTCAVAEQDCERNSVGFDHPLRAKAAAGWLPCAFLPDLVDGLALWYTALAGPRLPDGPGSREAVLINPILLFTHPLNSLLMIGIPFALGLYLTRRFGLSWRLFWIGGATFLLSQALHVPANLLLNRLYASGTLPLPPPSWQRAVLTAIAGLSAGLFEEGARYAMYRWWARDARSWDKALLLGAGHGGVESMALGLLTAVNVVAMFSLRGLDLSTIVPPDSLEAALQQVADYWSLPWFASLLGAVERLLTIPVQIGFSVLVLQVFIRGQIRWLFVAILWHAAIDGLVVGYAAPYLMTQLDWGMYAVEGLVAVATVVSLGLILLLREPKTSQDEPGALSAEPTRPFKPPEEGHPAPIPETRETLEDTRYDD